MSVFKFENRSKVKDKVTGFEGTIIGRTEWLNGCRRYGIQSSKLKEDGSILDPQWIDESQLELICCSSEKVDPKKGPEGPTSNPERNKDPK